MDPDWRCIFYVLRKGIFQPAMLRNTRGYFLGGNLQCLQNISWRDFTIDIYNSQRIYQWVVAFHVFYSHLFLGEGFQFDYRIFFKWVGEKPPTTYIYQLMRSANARQRTSRFRWPNLIFEWRSTKNLWFRTLHPRKINGWNIKNHLNWNPENHLNQTTIFRLQPLIFRGVTSLLFTGTRGWNLLQEVLLDLAESLAISMPEERPSEWEGFAGLNEFEDGRWSKKSSVN